MSNFFFKKQNFNRYMKNIPHIFYNQFDHLSKLAFKFRMPPSSHKTRINFGRANLFLQVKPPGSHVWQAVQVHDLPPLTSHERPPYLSVSPTPAPGRTTRAPPKRAASTSPEASRSSKSRAVGDGILGEQHVTQAPDLESDVTPNSFL